MKKMTGEIKLNYTYDNSHKGAPYTFDKVHYLNNGEFCEIVLKDFLGYDASKDANTPYDLGSDINEIKASVKSSRFTLTSKTLADNFEDTVKVYFKNVHSDKWIYVIVIENIITAYEMNAKEFKEFLYMFTSLNERKVIRAKATSTKMIAWFESKLK